MRGFAFGIAFVLLLTLPASLAAPTCAQQKDGGVACDAGPVKGRAGADATRRHSDYLLEINDSTIGVKDDEHGSFTARNRSSIQLLGSSGQERGAAVTRNVTWTVDTEGPSSALVYNVTAADLDQDGSPDLFLAGNHTRPGRPTFGDITLRAAGGRSVHCLDATCEAYAPTPAGALVAGNDDEATYAFVFAAGAGHGCRASHDVSLNAIRNCK